MTTLKFLLCVYKDMAGYGICKQHKNEISRLITDLSLLRHEQVAQN